MTECTLTISQLLWVRSPGLAQLGALLQGLPGLQSRCQLGLQSYVRVSWGRLCPHAHVVVDNIQLLAGCWTEGLRSLLAVGWGRLEFHVLQPSSCDCLLPQSQRGREPPSKMGVSISHNVITEVASHHFVCILLVRSKSLVPSTLKGKGMNTRSQGLRGHLQVSPPPSFISTGWSHGICTQLKALDLFLYKLLPSRSSHLEQLISRT